MAENPIENPEKLINPLDSREAGFESQADKEQREAAEFSAAKVATEQGKDNIGLEARPTTPTPGIETILERPQPVVADADPKLQEALTQLEQAQGLVEKIGVLNSWMTSNKLAGHSAVEFMDQAMEQVKALQQPK